MTDGLSGSPPLGRFGSGDGGMLSPMWLVLLLACHHAPPAVAEAAAPVASADGTVDERVFDGCPDDQVQFAMVSIASAVQVGAPLYNAGDHAGCYRLYLGTAADVSAHVPQCAGVRTVLDGAIRAAASQSGYSQQAWTLRFAFDALVQAWSVKYTQQSG